MYTEDEAQRIAKPYRGRLINAGQTFINASGCPRCHGQVRITLRVGPLGQKKDIADVHCDDCGERRDIEWP